MPRGGVSAAQQAALDAAVQYGQAVGVTVRIIPFEEQAMKCATVYQFKRELILHAMSKTADGVWILTEPCERFPSDVGDDVLGQALQAALKRSRVGIPHPTDFRAVTAPLLRVAGVKSWSTFAKSALCVEVEEPQPDVVELIPTENKGAEDGFVPRGDKRSVRSLGDAELGRAVRAALA